MKTKENRLMINNLQLLNNRQNNCLLPVGNLSGKFEIVHNFIPKRFDVTHYRMSTFSGKIEEIPNISVDRFDENNTDSEVYFLSHCHSDHMVGLHKLQFQLDKKYLYASEVSCAILKRQFPKLGNNLQVLDMHSPTIITTKEGNLSVLPISAGHCPGSVMFLFETNICILYTGDYRINKSDIRKLKSFYDSHNQVKVIEKIYLDTTFFLKNYLKFPKREESLDKLCKIIKEWISSGKNHIVNLCTSAKYGYEYVFSEIYNKIGMPIHVNKDAFKFYSIIPEMDKCVTLEGATTQIHCSCGSSYQHICDSSLDTKIRAIKLSALRWTQDNLKEGFCSNNYNMYYICYSTHASYEEGLELIRFLKPKSVEICVKHDDPSINLEILELIEEALNECKSKEVYSFQHKLFAAEENFSENVVNVTEIETCFNIDNSGILDSPPRNTDSADKNIETNNTNVCAIDNIHKLKCKSSVNPVQAHIKENWPDTVTVHEHSDILELDSIEPPRKKLR